MVDYVREMTVKKSCEYGNYGSFEHLLFLFQFWLALSSLTLVKLGSPPSLWVGKREVGEGRGGRGGVF